MYLPCTIFLRNFFLFESTINYLNSFCTFFPDHQNWFGVDDHLGPVAISIRRERIGSGGSNAPIAAAAALSAANANSAASSANGADNGGQQLSLAGNDVTSQFLYRLIVRTSELQPLRGCVLEESILPQLKGEKVKAMPTREVLEFVCPELQLSR